LAELLVPYQPALGPYRERLVTSALADDTTLLPALAYLDPGTLLAAIDRVRAWYGTPDPRVAASLWNKHYNAAVLPGILAAMTLTGVGLNTTITNAGIVLRDGVPMTLRLDSLAEATVFLPRFPGMLRDCDGRSLRNVQDLHQMVLTGLFREHLQLIIDRLADLTRLSKKILWDNAGNLCADLYERIAASYDALAAVAEDRRVLLEILESLVIGQRNLLHQSVGYQRLATPGMPATVRVRRTCCLRYRSPESEPCYACPLLTTSERIAVMKQHAAV
jgi:ferric iron reductase protein FhuF